MATLTYAQFHALFVLPPLLGLGVVTTRRRRESDVRLLPVVVITVLALLYTTPWDNYLIARGVWWYGEGAVAARIWLAPVEEYLFILLQPLVATLWLHQLPGRLVEVDVTRRDRLLGVAGGLVVSAVGVAALTRPATFYVGAILAWAGPVFALQWGAGWPYLVARWRTVLAGIAVPTVYFWIADAIALRNEVWSLSTELTTGIAFAGLPIEEATFFLVTNTFVIQGLVLYRWVVDEWL